MKFTDTSEAGLETAIVKSLIEEAGYQAGNPQDYHRAYAVDCSMRVAMPKNNREELSADDADGRRLKNKENNLFDNPKKKSAIISEICG